MVMKSKLVPPKFDVLISELGLGRQSVDLKEVMSVLIGDVVHKCRIEIKSDSYDFQCYAKMSLWKADKMEWVHLDSIHYSAMATQSKLYSSCDRNNFERNKTIIRHQFEKDVKELQKRALLILT